MAFTTNTSVHQLGVLVLRTSRDPCGTPVSTLKPWSLSSLVPALKVVIQYEKSPESLRVPAESRCFPPSARSFLPPFSLGQLACLTAAMEEIGSVDYQAKGGS